MVSYQKLYSLNYNLILLNTMNYLNTLIIFFRFIGYVLSLGQKLNYDLIIASRYLKKSKILNWPFSRTILSKLSNLLAKILLNIDVSDYTNGYRFYSKRSAKLITNKCGKIGDGFIILSEILLIISKKKYKIGETHSTFINRKRGESSVI